MGGKGRLRRLGGLRRVGQVGQLGQVRRVGQVGGQAERAFVRSLSFIIYSAAPARRLLFANCSLIVRLTFGEGVCV